MAPMTVTARADKPPEATRAASLMDLLTLRPSGNGVFHSQHSQRNPGGTIFGGALIGQVMAAATHGVEVERAAHHLQLTFLAPGQVNEPVDFYTERLLEGRNFSVVRVTGKQGDRHVVTGQVSFHRPELGPRFQHNSHPLTSLPDGLPTLQDVAHRYAHRFGDAVHRLKPMGALDIRFPDGGACLFERQPTGRIAYWVKCRERLPQQPAWHACALGFMSDYWFPLTAISPHLDVKVGHGLHVTSLNHCIWIHQAVEADEWLYVDAHSPASGGARGVSQCEVYNLQGHIVSSWAQENLFRGWHQTPQGLITPAAARNLTNG